MVASAEPIEVVLRQPFPLVVAQAGAVALHRVDAQDVVAASARKQLEDRLDGERHLGVVVPALRVEERVDPVDEDQAHAVHGAVSNPAATLVSSARLAVAARRRSATTMSAAITAR